MKLVKYEVLAGEIHFSQRSAVESARAALKLSTGYIREKKQIGFFGVTPTFPGR
jgi:hypothetical protein